MVVLLFRKFYLMENLVETFIHLLLNSTVHSQKHLYKTCFIQTFYASGIILNFTLEFNLFYLITNNYCLY